MKKFLRHLCLFLLLLAVLAVGADYVISKGLSRTQRGHFYTMNALMNDTLNADIIVLGNSRVTQDYDIHILDSALQVNTRSLGVSAQPFYVDYLRYRLYMRHNRAPRLIVLNTDFRELRMETHGYEREQYYPYILDTLVRPYLIAYEFSWAERNLPLYRYRGDYKMMGIGIAEYLHLFHDTKGDYDKGFSPRDVPWDQDYLPSYQALGTIEGAYEKDAVLLLDSLLAELQERQIPIVFSFPPFYADFYDILNEDSTRAAYFALAQKYAVPVLDNSRMAALNDTAYFCDACHLNSLGARVFTLRLTAQLDSLRRVGYFH